MAQEGEKVVLNIYDLSQGLARQLSSSLLGKVIDGIWHTGVAVYGREYYFGGGIQRTPIGRTPYGKPLRVVDLGFTQIPKEMFEEYLNEIGPRYTQETYNVLRHNCNNFSEEIAQFLVGNSIPEYILGLPDEVMNSPMGSMLLPMIQQLETTLKHNQAPAIPKPSGSPTVPDFSDIHLPTSVGVSLKHPNSSPTGRNGSSPTTTTTVNSLPTKSESSDIPLKTENVQEKGAESLEEKGKAEELPKDDLRQARAKVQEEITHEFMALMASGSLRASEAAALAARRVMARHGIATN